MKNTENFSKYITNASNPDDNKNSTRKESENKEKVKQRSKSMILMEGYLLKENPHGLFQKGFKKRWFSLVGTSLHYKETDTSAVALGTIELNEIIEIKLSEGIRTLIKIFFFILTIHDHFKGKNKETCFELIIKGRTYVLSANTIEERKKWIDALERARKKSSKKANTQSKSSSLSSFPQMSNVVFFFHSFNAVIHL